MLVKARSLKDSFLKRVEIFRKSLFFELLMTSKRWELVALFLGLVSVGLNLFTAALFLPSLMRVLNLKQKFSVLDEIDSFASRFFVINEGYYLGFFALITALIFFKSAIMLYKEWLGSKIMTTHGIFLKRKTIRHLAEKALSFFHIEGSGALSYFLGQGIQMGMGACHSFINILIYGISVFASFCLLFWVSWPLTLLVFLLAIPLVRTLKKIRGYSLKLTNELVVSCSKLEQIHLNFLSGIRFLKLSSKETSQADEIVELSRLSYKRSSFSSVMGYLLSQVNEGFGVFCLFFLVFVAFLNPMQVFSVTNPATFLSFLMVFARTIQSYNTLNLQLNGFVMTYAYLSKIEKFLINKKEIDMNWGDKSLPCFEDNIRIKNLDFVYPKTERKVLNSVDILISKGEQVAIVGPSGSGKSTLLDLILGFYIPTVGTIEINGKNYKEFALKDYRKLFGLVSQESNIFFPTIRENLTLFKSDASELEMRRALSYADALDFIDKLPEGIDTVIGERGVMLSGGQKQRLSIARALLHNPEILIFDEATSSLDSLSEARIVESIKKASVGRTTITVAHRLSTVMHCDKVFFLENGWVVEEGSPQELMRKKSRFKRYAEAQSLSMKMSG
jgi:subfamily B ATP-binding cassette protein MsbA